MTDRRIGGTGANVDINVAADRRTGGLGVQVDVAPPQTFERQADSVSLMVEVVPPTGDVTSALDLSVDLVPVHPSGRLSQMGVMVDYVLSLIPTTAVRWSGALFEMGTASPLTYWSAGAFRASGTNPVIWNTDHFEMAP